MAVSCLADVDAEDVLPPFTAYYVMRVGSLPLVPYYPPGDLSSRRRSASLPVGITPCCLANHGPVVAGDSLETAVNAIEELEETAKLFMLLRHERCRPLTPAQVDDVGARFPIG